MRVQKSKIDPGFNSRERAPTFPKIEKCGRLLVGMITLLDLLELIIQYANEFHECDICLVVMETRPDTDSISRVLDVTDISLRIVILRHPVASNNSLQSPGSVIPGNKVYFYHTFFRSL